MPKLMRFAQQLFRLGFRGHISEVIVHLVAFSPAGIEVVRQVGNCGSHGQIERLKGGLMMPRAGYAVTGAGDGHSGKLQRGIVSCREPPVGGKVRNGCVREVSLDDGSQVVKLLPAGGVAPDALFC